MKHQVLILCIFAITLWSCKKVESFPPEPEISFVALDVQNGQGKLRLTFADGDGDMGLSQSDTSGIYCSKDCLFYWNLFCEYYELENGIWIHRYLDPFDNKVPFYYRVPYIKPSGQNPSLKGEIDIDMPIYYLSTASDTFRFEIQLYDRALHGSNIVITPAFIKP